MEILKRSESNRGPLSMVTGVINVHKMFRRRAESLLKVDVCLINVI